MKKRNLLVMLGALATMSCSENKKNEPHTGVEPLSAACEINYSVLPHKKAIKKLGTERLEAIWSVRSSFEDEQRFIESFDYITADIFAVFGIHDIDNGVDINTIYGGYKGFTSPALNVEIDLSKEITRQKLVRVAAAIGYVFAQDSVILQCTPEDGDINLIPSFEITEEGSVDAINKTSIKSIYGMMIGESGGDLDQGFSYYPYRDRFSVLGFSPGGGKDREIVNRISDQISNLSGKAHSVIIKERFRWVAFPSNDWARFPNGGGYAQDVWSDTERQQLDLVHLEFVAQLDRVLALAQ